LQGGGVLWSDPRDEPSREAREAQRKLRRAAWLIAVIAVLGAIALVHRY
jgi:hypothetical protein